MVAVLDRTIYRGDTKLITIGLWSNRYQQVPFDLTGATLLGQVRAAVDGTVLCTLTCTVLAAVAPSTIRNKVSIELTAANSATLSPGAVLVWDVQATMTDSRVYTLVGGKFTISGDVSH